MVYSKSIIAVSVAVSLQSAHIDDFNSLAI